MNQFSVNVAAIIHDIIARLFISLFGQLIQQGAVTFDVNQTARLQNLRYRFSMNTEEVMRFVPFSSFG